MATAKLIQEEPIKYDRVSLTLSNLEAAVLLKILNNVGGSPHSARGIADPIRKALVNTGILPDKSAAVQAPLYFKS